MTPLSKRELEALHWRYCGKTNVESARLMGCHFKTESALIRKARYKIGARSIPQLVGKAVELGIVGQCRCAIEKYRYEQIQYDQIQGEIS